MAASSSPTEGEYQEPGSWKRVSRVVCQGVPGVVIVQDDDGSLACGIDFVAFEPPPSLPGGRLDVKA